LINITSDQEAYAREVQETLQKAGVRVDTDFRNEKLGYKIREAQLQKVPYMIVLGDKEVAAKTVSPRFWDGKQLDAMSTAAFIDLIKNDCGELWGL
jgi:threonyl-tRNA synthetase